MHVKAAIKDVPVHHNDGFMIRKRVKEAVLLSIVVFCFLFFNHLLLAASFCHNDVYGLSVDESNH